ncbi:rCG21574 [Rattus norvegicus]|uniref:RCG21574 n=1 Tax=Rattus norvegicus TaxID=10116 RepID=A6J1K9_RAT|nr:rCG21574 [Rattus norvegicus]
MVLIFKVNPIAISLSAQRLKLIK